MKRKRSKRKIITKNKQYPIRDSVLYKLSNKKKLATLLDLPLSELKKLADDSNYRCFIQKQKGKSRIIQEPLNRLDRVHTKLASFLSRIETTDELHSGKKGRSNISNAKAHLGHNKKVITADIKKFYPSTTQNKVFDFFFNTMKCSPDVSDLLSKILTYNNHVPTGSRISMPLSYFSNKRMFDELSRKAAGSDAIMTIYVDDLTFSGSSLTPIFIETIELVAKKYGHKIHPSKTRYYGSGEVKLITGAAVIGVNLKPRNKHLAVLNEDMTKWLESSSRDKKLESRVLGRMSFIGCIDSRYKDKARSFRQSMQSSV